MKIRIAVLVLIVICTAACAQNAVVKNINAVNPPDVALAPLRYLASDELKGRGITLPEINIAAQYIADQFKSFGVKTIPAANGYFQEFDLKMLTPGLAGKVTIGPLNFIPGNNILQLEPEDIDLKAPLVYIGYVKPAELDAMDFKGKIVLADLGTTDKLARADFALISAMRAALAKKGAVALIERFTGKLANWLELAGYLSSPRPASVDDVARVPALIVNDTPELHAPGKGYSANAVVSISGTKVNLLHLKNVMGFIEGTDAKLRDQYLLLTSHYDHLGVGKPEMEEGKLDSIYNGARDNATGTTGVIDAARYFAKYPPARSVLFITYTAEESGLIGSTYYAAHPLVPLNKTVYNLNIDNASYDNTKLISLVGLGRTTADDDIKKACAAYGMSVTGDPTTGGKLFFGSDNYPLAVKGVPAPTFSFGMEKFGPEIFKRYHQLSDEVGNMDLDYVMKFIDAYILAAKYIADEPQIPAWTKGDEFEKVAQALYGGK